MPKEELDDINQEIDKKSIDEEKKKLKEEQKAQKAEQKAQKKEAKKRAKEIALQEEQLDEDTSNVSVFFVTFFIVVIWVAILCFLVKLDIGGFGSGVLTPILKDVPVLNKILPAGSEVLVEDAEQDAYGGYKSLREAVDYIKELELELERAQSAQSGSTEEVEQLRAEVARLQEFEDRQVEFQRIKTEFYEEVVYAENGPGAEAYRKYYEEIDPATAEYLYKQVVQQLEETKEIQDWAKAYSEMKPKAAAGIFEAMTDNLDMVARILGVMEADKRGAILAAMNSDVAAKITKIMDPES